VEVRSLGYRTDLAILALEGSRVTDRGDHLVIRTPGNPDYWWGNFLLLRDLRPGSGAGWMARFAAEFPDARHMALGLDQPDVRAAGPGELPGMTMERNAVMTATSLHAPPHPDTGAVYRALEGDADWRQSLELAAAVHAGEPGGDARFLTAQLAAKRALTEAGHGAWSGAFLDGTLVSQLGLVTVKSGLARYQSVETHPAARRRGLAGTLVWHAGATALTGGTRTLVMVAEPGDAAIRVYRSVGFTITEPQLSFIHQPAQSLPAKVTRTRYHPTPATPSPSSNDQAVRTNLMRVGTTRHLAPPAPPALTRPPANGNRDYGYY
jgi:ribosomal protein S18 acetylase RimI-like enzyme